MKANIMFKCSDCGVQFLVFDAEMGLVHCPYCFKIMGRFEIIPTDRACPGGHG